MRTPFHLRRAGVAVAGAALLLAGAAGANAAGGPQPAPVSTGRPSPPPPSPTPPWRRAPTGSSSASSRAASSTPAAGGALTAPAPSARREQLHLPGRPGSHLQHPGHRRRPPAQPRRHLPVPELSDLKGWAAARTAPRLPGELQPVGPVADMVTMPVDALGRFNLQTPGTAHVFADVAGYFVQPLYAIIDGTEGPTPTSWTTCRPVWSATRTSMASTS